ncbi:MAG: HDOD domain-containing protein [Planctomycetota bacterium]|nr:MAG: HDOD domain-containing protein [Planctomycetota bacterium]
MTSNADTPTQKLRILFVDDESNVLNGLRRMLHAERNRWDMAFASSGEEALRLLDESPFDIVVSDMRMPGMDGAELLARVMEQHPDCVRIVLSGYSSEEAAMRSVGPAHQFLSKPCEAHTLRDAVDRACALRTRLRSRAVAELAGRLKTIPSAPALYRELVEELRQPDATPQTVARIIEKDAGMTAKTLQLVNSAFFGLPRRVSNLSQAVGFLGLDTIRSLVLSVQAFDQFKNMDITGFSVEALWRHSLEVGSLARSIAAAENAPAHVCDDALLAGLLHDAGKLILAANLPDAYAQAMQLVEQERLALHEAERRTTGAGHPETCAYLLGLWGLPDAIVEAVAFHHEPSLTTTQEMSPLLAVHAADAIVRDAVETTPEESDAASPALDRRLIQDVGLIDRLDAWRALAHDPGGAAHAA